MAHQLLYTVLQASSLPRLILYFSEEKKHGSITQHYLYRFGQLTVTFFVEHICVYIFLLLLCTAYSKGLFCITSKSLLSLTKMLFSLIVLHKSICPSLTHLSLFLQDATHRPLTANNPKCSFSSESPTIFQA